jgi:mannose-6-phosphate isomerase-like protein (cupin superfamily)
VKADYVHFSQDEMFCIVKGGYELTIGGQTSTAGPGTIVFILRNVVHRFKNVGDTTARCSTGACPGGGDRTTTSELMDQLLALAPGPDPPFRRIP